jgi:hypothetical protein
LARSFGGSLRAFSKSSRVDSVIAGS